MLSFFLVIQLTFAAPPQQLQAIQNCSFDRLCFSESLQLPVESTFAWNLTNFEVTQFVSLIFVTVKILKPINGLTWAEIEISEVEYLEVNLFSPNSQNSLDQIRSINKRFRPIRGVEYPLLFPNVLLINGSEVNYFEYIVETEPLVESTDIQTYESFTTINTTITVQRSLLGTNFKESMTTVVNETDDNSSIEFVEFAEYLVDISTGLLQFAIQIDRFGIIQTVEISSLEALFQLFPGELEEPDPILDFGALGSLPVQIAIFAVLVAIPLIYYYTQTKKR
ncbi:MAG: hypothetical protein ACW99A_22950 [Candidatus Kariarchaeaceae archaeon]|jgi:hypothetical protein